LEKTKELESDSDSDIDMNYQDEEVIRNKLKVNPKQAFPMFPYVEPKRSFDVWGQIINPADFKFAEEERKDQFEEGEDGDEGKGSGLLGSGVGVVGNLLEGDADGDTEMETENKKKSNKKKQQLSQQSKEAKVQAQEKAPEPKKTIWETCKVEVKCQVQYIDFEGRSDGKSIRNILSHVQPRKLILLRGTAESTRNLKEYCEKNICKEVFCPKAGQLVDITSETNIYRATLKDNLTQSLRFVKVGDYEIAYVDGEIQVNYSQSPLPMLQRLPQAKGHPAVFLGEVKFSDLKLLLNQAGIECDFHGGVLVCGNGAVNIIKTSKTQISIQGSLCTDYYKIRSLLYSQYQIL